MKESAQIYKSDLRFRSEDEAFRRLSVFNFDEYSDDSRLPFGKIIAFNEETLGPKHKVFRHIARETDIILIPLAGALLYSDSMENQDFIETEQIRVLSAGEGMTYTLENPYVDDLISYLQIWIEPSENNPANSTQKKFAFPGKNNLFPIFGPDQSDDTLQIRQQAMGFLGIFDGRKEGRYELSDPKNGLFAFVINGAFEFQNRLIEKSDALALSGLASADFEALSENALLLLIETSL